MLDAVAGVGAGPVAHTAVFHAQLGFVTDDPKISRCQASRNAMVDAFVDQAGTESTEVEEMNDIRCYRKNLFSEISEVDNIEKRHK